MTHVVIPKFTKEDDPGSWFRQSQREDWNDIRQKENRSFHEIRGDIT